MIFLDEPTDGVDPVGRHQIREVIQKMCDDGTTVFLNSHLLLEVEQICDHVAIMHHGEILQQGTVDEIRAAVSSGGAKLSVRFVTSEVSKETRKELRELGKTTRLDDSISVLLEQAEDTSKAIDILRKNDVQIFAVEPSKASLEDAFINVISEQEDQGVGGTQL